MKKLFLILALAGGATSCGFAMDNLEGSGSPRSSGSQQKDLTETQESLRAEIIKHFNNCHNIRNFGVTLDKLKDSEYRKLTKNTDREKFLGHYIEELKDVFETLSFFGYIMTSHKKLAVSTVKEILQAPLPSYDYSNRTSQLSYAHDSIKDSFSAKEQEGAEFLLNYMHDESKKLLREMVPYVETIVCDELLKADTTVLELEKDIKTVLGEIKTFQEKSDLKKEIDLVLAPRTLMTDAAMKPYKKRLDKKDLKDIPTLLWSLFQKKQKGDYLKKKISFLEADLSFYQLLLSDIKLGFLTQEKLEEESESLTAQLSLINAINGN